MSLHLRDRAAVQKRLWDEVEASRVAMLGIQGYTSQLNKERDEQLGE